LGYEKVEVEGLYSLGLAGMIDPLQGEEYLEELSKANLPPTDLLELTGLAALSTNIPRA